MTLIGFLPKPHVSCHTMIGYFYFVSHFLNISFLTRTLQLQAVLWQELKPLIENDN